MKTEEIKINETHICILKGSATQIYVELYPLVFEFEKEFSQLETIASNQNRKSYELFDYVINGPLKCLMKRFDFCEDLELPYQGIYPLITEDFIDYNEEFANFMSELRRSHESELNKIQDHSEADIQDKIMEYHNNKRLSVFNNLKIRKTAFMMKQAYQEIEKQKDILAFSHRRIGWSAPEFRLNDDFEVIFKTNFGYGHSSYFFTNIRYKGIDLLPYSDWIRYSIVQESEIIRYTRRHKLENIYWRNTMDFTTEMFNDSQNYPGDFVNKWIINECLEMISGLELLLNRDQEYELDESYFHPSQKIKIEGRGLIKLKGEKISGALKFIDSIKSLMIFSDSIPLFIERILKCNLNIYPQLNIQIKICLKEINNIENKIDNIIKMMTDLQKEKKNLQLELTNYNRELKQIVDKFESSKHPETLTALDFSKLRNEFIDSHPSYKQCSNKISELEKNYKELEENYAGSQKELANERGLYNKFLDYSKTIEHHFSSINRPLIEKAS